MTGFFFFISTQKNVEIDTKLCREMQGTVGVKHQEKGKGVCLYAHER
jgi:hypothetical protein